MLSRFVARLARPPNYLVLTDGIYLQRHRLVKGCENKSKEATAVDDNGHTRAGEGEDVPMGKDN